MKDRIQSLLKRREISVIAFMLLIFIGVGVVNSSFLQFENIMITLKGSSLYIFLAIGLTFVIFTKEIDVSVGSTLGFSAAVAATMLRDGKNVFLAIIIAILIGGLIGLINGIGVTKFKIPSIVMTLGTMGIIRGLMFIYTGGQWVENLPNSFKSFSQKEILGFNIFFVIATIAIIFTSLYAVKSTTGKSFKAIGDNSEGAFLIGIKVDKIKILAFILSGVCASIAGLIYTSQIGFVASVAGQGIEMVAIAACVLGGVSLNGGTGSIIGAGLGAIIMTSINSALVFLKVPAYWNNTISGMLLIMIVVTDVLIQRRKEEKIKREKLCAKFNVNRGELNEKI
ncbi:MAG: ABC transporter permease subunit [Sarcina sp.]